MKNMTMIGDENEGVIIDSIIDNLPDSFTYEDLEHLRKENFSVKHEWKQREIPHKNTWAITALPEERNLEMKTWTQKKIETHATVQAIGVKKEIQSD